MSKKDKELDKIMDEVDSMMIKPPVIKKGLFKIKGKNMSKEQFKKAKSAHKKAIAKIKAERKKLKQDIKQHKLLIKQAKIAYKLSKTKGKR